MRVLLGMSGGLDSTYAACRLRSLGYEVEGAFLAMHGYSAAEEARESAKALGIPLHEIDCRERFRETVIRNFTGEYRAGRTPNPCVLCNREVKFRELLRFADENGFDRIATGHYAMIGEEEGRYYLLRGNDPRKEQSYMLWRLGQDVLSRLLLPLGENLKTEVRAAAKAESLLAADREESQEICFIPDRDYAAFIEAETGASPPGSFVDTTGKVLGTHRGILHYTVGQRRGLGIALGERMFVREIRPGDNTVVLSPADGEGVSSFRVGEVHFSGMPEAQTGDVLTAECAVRYQANPVGATVRILGSGEAEITLSAPVRCVTPGQSAVFYKGNRLLLGGIILHEEGRQAEHL